MMKDPVFLNFFFGKNVIHRIFNNRKLVCIHTCHIGRPGVTQTKPYIALQKLLN